MAECADVYTEEATKLILLGSDADAIANLTHAIALKPDDPSLLVRRGGARARDASAREGRATRTRERDVRRGRARAPP